MIKTAPHANLAKRLSPATKRAMALQAIGRQQPIADLSRHFACSRTTVYQQKQRALEAVANAFEDSDEQALFSVAVTPSCLHKMVVALFLICRSSYRGILSFLESMFGYSLSLGSVFNILESAAEQAAVLNDAYDLGPIKSSAVDELFHRNRPLLGVVDIDSRFCALLAKSERRDQESWTRHLRALQARGYAPDTCVADGAKGLVKGHETVLPGTTLRLDHFHCIRDLKDCARFLKNAVASKVTGTLKLWQRMDKERKAKKKTACSRAMTSALAELHELEETHATFQTLSGWLQHDILQLAGHRPEERAMLYDFIVAEMRLLASRHPHRIGAMVTSLIHRREALLAVANALNGQFASLAAHYQISIDTLWKVCYIARYGIDSCHYHDQSSALESAIGDRYEEIEDAVLAILANTHRCSSLVENLNSRVRPYLEERKFVSQKTLGLLQFYLNHKPFMRSRHERLVKKTPAEAMTGKPHRPWLEMLGFPAVKEYVS
jgi:hypothetical protein